MEFLQANNALMVEAGDVLDGRFKLDSVLGEGAQGMVWLSTDLKAKGHK
jgi:hypothetical protein